MKIGTHDIAGQVILAPMAGVTDLPFRNIAREFDVSLAVSEMLSVKPELRDTRKSSWRHNHEGETGLRMVQIVGTDPLVMAAGAQYNAEKGADIIDINMGCPAKKVCNKAAGSALLKDEQLVAEILRAVVKAVDIPVTLKIRTGWSSQQRNAVNIARIAQESGIQALAVHGRTREDAFKGEAEYETIAEVKQAVSIPVFANGDINSIDKAKNVLDFTGADALMIGRAAQGNPWLIRRMQRYLMRGERLLGPRVEEVLQVMRRHLNDMYVFYGEQAGLRIARKHIGWYCAMLPGGSDLKSRLFQVKNATDQLEILDDVVELAEVLKLRLAA